jgi:hypothetical protein
MAIESVEASEFVESLGSRTGTYKQRAKALAIVIHTTGSGPVVRWRKEQGKPGKEQATPFLTAVHRTYRAIMAAGPHYVVGQAGECVQVCAERLAAWHVGSDDSAAYVRPQWLEARYEWWAERWPELTSPTQLADGRLWAGGSCNINTIGIEVVPPAADVRASWSQACWTRLERLVRDIASRHGIPMRREYIVTHSDAHPVARTDNRGEPWDPGSGQWDGWPVRWESVQPAVTTGTPPAVASS